MLASFNESLLFVIFFFLFILLLLLFFFFYLIINFKSLKVKAKANIIQMTSTIYGMHAIVFVQLIELTSNDRLNNQLLIIAVVVVE